MKDAFTELQALDSSVLRQEILEHVGGPIAELLIGSGTFEGRVEAARVLDPHEDAASTAIFWTTNDITKSSFVMPAGKLDFDLGRHDLLPVISTGINFVLGVSEVNTASLTASVCEPVWKIWDVYLASMPIKKVVTDSIVVADNVGLSNCLNWRIPNPRNESVEWAA